MPFAPGTSNTLNLHLGIASVGYDAAVTDWNDVTPVVSSMPILTFTNDTPMSLPLIEGSKTATAHIQDGATDVSDDYTYEWSSSAEGVATVVDSGTKTTTVTPVSAGEATIQVWASRTSDQSMVLTASFRVSVN